MHSSKFLWGRRKVELHSQKMKFIATNFCWSFSGLNLSHVDELGEDLRSLLGCVSAEDHQLHPLGDAVAHHDGALESRVVPDRALHHIAAVVQELGPLQRVTGSSCCKVYETYLTSVKSFKTRYGKWTALIYHLRAASQYFKTIH